MTNTVVEQTWQAEEYHANSSAQSVAAMQILQCIKFKGSEHVLDVGCGDGKITARIADSLERGSVLGVDASPEMIHFAQKTFQNSFHPNLRFSLQNASQLNYNGEFDVVFSSFTLHWVLNQHLFLKGAYKSLKPSGRLIVTVPLDFSLALEESTKATISKPEWSPYFHNFFQNWRFIGKAEFTQLLVVHQFIPKRMNEVTQKEFFPSRKCLEKYIYQWFPYFHPLPDHLKGSFFEEVMNDYFEREPLLENGKALLRFSRLDIVAEKTFFHHRIRN